MNEHSQKQGNKNKIYRFIHEHRETFRQQIADELHISLSTISQNLSHITFSTFLKHTKTTRQFTAIRKMKICRKAKMLR